jgi:hypothetical protein
VLEYHNYCLLPATATAAAVHRLLPATAAAVTVRIAALYLTEAVLRCLPCLELDAIDYCVVYTVITTLCEAPYQYL